MKTNLYLISPADFDQLINPPPKEQVKLAPYFWGIAKILGAVALALGFFISTIDF